MGTDAPQHEQFRSFGPFTVDLASSRIECDEVPIEIERKACDILKLLIVHPGQVVTYEEFKNQLWPDVAVVVTANLNTQVNKLRKALGESSRKPFYVMNKRGEGYYFNRDVPVHIGRRAVPQNTQLPDGLPTVPSAPVAPSSHARDGDAGGMDNLLTRRRPIWKRPAAVAVAIVLIGLAVLLSARHVSHTQEPSRVAVNGRVLAMLDQEGGAIWHFELPSRNPPPLPDPADFERPHPVIADLDDGKKELLYVVHDDDAGAAADTVYCFGPTGKVRWTHQIGRELQSISTARVYPKHYSLTWIGVLHRATPAGGKILVGGHRGGSSMFCIELLTSQGKVVGEYYHPGWLWAIGLMDLDGDGSDEIILGGVNNAYGNLPGFDHPMTLVVLDSLHVQGQGPAPDSDDRHFQGLSSGRERAVLFFRNFGGLPTDPPSNFCLFQSIHPAQGHFEAIAVKLGDRGVYADFQFDRHLNLEMVSPSPALDAWLDEHLSRPSRQIQRVIWYKEQLGNMKVLKNDFATGRSP
jgi:DNA-binding winged helix-turn-helix (wHTH) protein